MEKPVFATFALDVLGPQPPMLLPSASVRSSSSMAETSEGGLDQAVSESLKERVSTLLATEFSRKVCIWLIPHLVPVRRFGAVSMLQVWLPFWASRSSWQPPSLHLVQGALCTAQTCCKLHCSSWG